MKKLFVLFKNITLVWRAILITLIVAIAISFFIYYSNTKENDLGNFGDAISGIVGTILTFFSGVLIYFSFREQSKTNIKADKELTHIRAVHYYGLLEKQLPEFEPSLLEWINEIPSVYLSYTANRFHELSQNPPIIKLRNYIQDILEYIVFRSKAGAPIDKHMHQFRHLLLRFEAISNLQLRMLQSDTFLGKILISSYHRIYDEYIVQIDVNLFSLGILDLNELIEIDNNDRNNSRNRAFATVYINFLMTTRQIIERIREINIKISIIDE
ncbi:MAG: hypothetical protein IPG60_11445 [Bacteroidetes bacterium]|nr:hypothetical protein [Bacteroidota bacterium]MBP8755246.1 hypothetical protein [Chitinophagales bacterium]MBK7109573.1 hypothetical protein [Bacteroidota bacterium]MBK8487692.1 hypothetical protein [Bacteroidota bacterium]MBK8682566.1 hypothetical protein [Bacteroidota bacterium]